LAFFKEFSMKRLFVLLSVVAMGSVSLFSGCASGESVGRAGYDFTKIRSVAVVSVEGLKSKSAQNEIADFFNMELLRKGYSPVERSQIDKVLEEQRFERTGVTTPDGAARVGRILNVQAVIMINIPKFDEDVHMTAKMVDTEDASIVWLGSGKGTTGKTAATIFGAAAGAVAGVAASNWSSRGAGGVAGGVLGGAAGYMLTPDESVVVQKVIKEVTKTLPLAIPTAIPPPAK
jgi:hypothetical protein